MGPCSDAYTLHFRCRQVKTAVTVAERAGRQQEARKKKKHAQPCANWQNLMERALCDRACACHACVRAVPCVPCRACEYRRKWSTKRWCTRRIGPMWTNLGPMCWCYFWSLRATPLDRAVRSPCLHTHTCRLPSRLHTHESAHTGVLEHVTT